MFDIILFILIAYLHYLADRTLDFFTPAS